MTNTETYREFMARSDAGYGLLLLTIGAAVLLLGLFSTMPVGAFLRARGKPWPQFAAFGAPISLPFLPAIAPLPFLLLFGLLVRIPKLFEPLWYDETFSARIASTSWDNLGTAVMGDVHPPLHYILQWLAVRAFGLSELSLRFPALIAGLVLIWLVYRFTLALRFERRVALIATFIIAVMPAAIYYSVEARQYALLACLALGAAIAILEDRPNWFAACAFLLPWCHNIGFVYLGVLGLAALVYHFSLSHGLEFAGSVRRKWVLWVIYAGMLGGTWLPFMLEQSADVGDGFWLQPVTVAGALRPLTDMTATIKLPEPLVIPAYAPLVALVLISVFMSRHWLLTRRGWVWLALVIVVPIALYTVSTLWRPGYISRALLPCMVGIAVLWARAADEYRIARLLLIVGLGLALLGFYQKPRISDEIPAYLQLCRQADSIYNTSTAGAFMTAYYVPEMPQYLWANSNDLNQSLPDSAKTAMGFKQIESASQLKGRVCIFQVDNALSSVAQREHVAGLLAAYPHQTKAYSLNMLYNLYLHIVEIP